LLPDAIEILRLALAAGAEVAQPWRGIFDPVGVQSAACCDCLPLRAVHDLVGWVR
jgi:hypothetical protein